MLEKDIEKSLVRKIEGIGGEALKFNSTKSGMPDRLVLLPGGRAVFVEMKAPGEKPRPLQRKRIKEIRKLGFDVIVIDSLKCLELFIIEMRYRDVGIHTT